MPSIDSPALIVARFLKANRYHDTLAAFIAEAGLPENAGEIGKDDLSLEKVLEEKKIFDIGLKIEKMGMEEGDGRWSENAPSLPVTIPLPTSSNLLHVSLEYLGSKKPFTPILAATTADRRLHFLRAQDLHLSPLNPSSSFTSESPILSVIVLPYPNMSPIVSTSMSGKTVIYDHDSGTILSERQDHTKYVPSCAVTRPNPPPLERIWLATAGWDGKIFLYRLINPSMFQPPTLDSPVAQINLPTNPEAVAFVQHPDTGDWILLVTRQNSTSIYFYALPDAFLEAPLTERMTLLGSQNLAPHSTGWIAFSPASIAVCPTDSTLLAVATSSVPHMRLMIVRLLFPPMPTSRPVSPLPGGEAGLAPSSSSSSTITAPSSILAPTGQSTQATQAGVALELANKQEAAIAINISTFSPQTPYSTPKVVWRPDGTGVWVNGDDGAVRGIEAKTGKIVRVLKGGHKAGSKIRALGAGMVRAGGQEGKDGEGQLEEEWVVSGGFDQKLVIWKTPNGGVSGEAIGGTSS